jgi:hypothetical protein
MTRMTDEQADQHGAIIAFRASARVEIGAAEWPLRAGTSKQLNSAMQAP